MNSVVKYSSQSRCLDNGVFWVILKGSNPKYFKDFHKSFTDVQVITIATRQGAEGFHYSLNNRTPLASLFFTPLSITHCAFFTVFHPKMAKCLPASGFFLSETWFLLYQSPRGLHTVGRPGPQSHQAQALALISGKFPVILASAYSIKANDLQGVAPNPMQTSSL